MGWSSSSSSSSSLVEGEMGECCELRLVRQFGREPQKLWGGKKVAPGISPRLMAPHRSLTGSIF